MYLSASLHHQISPLPGQERLQYQPQLWLQIPLLSLQNGCVTRRHQQHTEHNG